MYNDTTLHISTNHFFLWLLKVLEMTKDRPKHVQDKLQTISNFSLKQCVLFILIYMTHKRNNGNMHIACPRNDNQYQSLYVRLLKHFCLLTGFSSFKILLVNWYLNSLIIGLAAKILAFSLDDSITSCNYMKINSDINKRWLM